MVGKAPQADAIRFANVYVPKPADITVPIDILKTVVNMDAESITPEGFRFLLKSDQDGDKGIIVMTDAQGMAQFTLTFTEDDIGKTFFYTLTEINDGREYVIYSTDEYKIAISIALDEETNTLVATYTQDDVATERLSASFENIYDPDGGAQTGDETITHIVIILTGICVLVSLYVYSKKRRWFGV